MTWPGTILLSILILGVAGAAPDKQPATRPTTQPVPNSTVVENAKYHFRLSIPKVWKKRPGKSSVSAVYEVPGPGGAAAGGLMVLLSASFPEGKVVLADRVDAKRKGVIAHSKDAKIITDEPATLGGVPAWRLIYDLPVQAKETTKINGKDAGSRTVTIHNRCLEYLCVNDKTQIQVTYVCLRDQYDARSKLAQKVVDSFEWTDDDDGEDNDDDDDDDDDDDEGE